MFDRAALRIKNISEREHDLGYSIISPLTPSDNNELINKFSAIADSIISSKRKGASVILMIGAHVIRSGVQKYIIDLMKRGYLSCIATNGAGIIHDYEFALIGATTESVAKYIREGQFGLWRETGVINDIINQSYRINANVGMGEAIGKEVATGGYPFKDNSLFAAAYQYGVSATVHVGIGYDIIHEHPNCDGAATGALSYNDFLKIAEIVQNLEGGVIMNFGSAIMAPEVFLKALSMARNVAHQRKEQIKYFTTLVCDLHELPENVCDEPSKGSADYYFRPWKTMLVRTVAEGGKSFYVKGKHAETVPALWTALNKIDKIQR